MPKRGVLGPTRRYVLVVAALAVAASGATGLVVALGARELGLDGVHRSTPQVAGRGPTAVVVPDLPGPTGITTPPSGTVPPTVVPPRPGPASGGGGTPGTAARPGRRRHHHSSRCRHRELW